MNLKMSIFRKPNIYDNFGVETPYDKASSENRELFNTTTDMLDAFKISNELIAKVLDVKSCYDSLFQPNLYSRADNIQRLASTMIPDALSSLVNKIESTKTYYRYEDTSYTFLQDTVKVAESFVSNIHYLMEQSRQLQFLNTEKKEYNLADILLIIKGHSKFKLDSNKLLDASCYNDKADTYLFDYSITFSNTNRDTFAILYTSPYPMHSVKLIETYIRETGIENLQIFKVNKI